MSMVDADDSSLQVDSQPKSVGLWVGIRLALSYIYQTNLVNSWNDLCHDTPYTLSPVITIIRPTIFIIIIIIIINMPVAAQLFYNARYTVTSLKG